LLLAAGRDADVFSLEDGRVLRRYRDGADATVEAEVMRYVARHGYPVPEVFDVTGPDLVMERVDGPTMADAVQAGGLDVDGAGTMLANLHDRLHDIPGRSQRTGEERVIHMDLHPLNVMVAPRGPVVIDWRNARDGEPGLDVAMSALILAQVALVAARPRALVAREILESLLAAVKADPLPSLITASGLRRGDANVTVAEAECLVEAESLVRLLAAG
jgi:aminoglycoside phosphotransferase (APT) family kinase protein